LTENGAIPIRWLAPECVRPPTSSAASPFSTSSRSLEVRNVTKEANVWSFGVLLWEVLELGARPYEELASDVDVLNRVIVERNYRLRLPAGQFPFKDRL
jgi:hypothetical protein